MKTLVKKQKIELKEKIEFEFLSIKQDKTIFNDIEEPSLKIWGRCDSGESIQISVIGFRPYFYFEIFKEVNDNTIFEIKKSLDHLVIKELSKEDRGKKIIEKIEQIKDRKSVMGYKKENSVFLKVTLTSPKFVTKLRAIVHENIGLEVNGRTKFKTFESDILYILRWMVNKGCTGGSWLRIDTKNIIKPLELESTCKLEYLVKTDDITILEERQDHAPFKLLSYDIECTSEKGTFCTPEKDAVIQIGVVIKTIGTTEMKKYCFNLKGCEDIEGSTIFCFEDERKMLESFSEFLVTEDPDIITGYNIQNFDFPYLFDRAKTLGSREFSKLSRVINKKCSWKITTFSSRAFGQRVSKSTEIEGRIVMDMIEYIRRNAKLRSYSLNAVSAHYLNDQKEDVHPSQISVLHEGTDKDRKRLVEYCIKDCELPIRLFDHLMVFYNFFEMSRVTGVPADFLLTRGQSIKTITQINRNTFLNGYLIPFKEDKDEGEDDDDPSSFEGATVVEPLRGYYDKPIATLDFASLYPSIMMAHNLCYSTLLTKEQAMKMSESDYTLTPSGCYFVKPHIRKGLLPMILENILAARKRARGELAVEKDKQKQIILDCKQLALKITANSVYGFTGATIGKLPCLDISASVTAFGRQMIEMTSNLVREKYSIKNGHCCDAVILYGDSVTGETPVLLQEGDFNFYYQIDELDSFTYERWKLYKDEKEYIDLSKKDIKVWSDKGFVNIKKIIRHKTTKNIYRIITNTGLVDVTEDHSLLNEFAEKVTPKDVKVGDKLLHNDLPMLDNFLLSWEAYLQTKFLIDEKNGDIIFNNESQIGASIICHILNSLNYTCYINFEEDKYIVRCVKNNKPQRKDPSKIKKIINLGQVTDYVYDLETENGHFSAGIGRIVVHNTDSVMVNFGVDTVAEAMKLGKEAAQHVSARFIRPINLDFEKVYYPYLLINKKRYAGLFWTKPDKYDKLDAKGIESVRRDNCLLTKNLVEKCIFKLLTETPAIAIDYAKEMIGKLTSGEIDISQLVITKQLNKDPAEYATKAAHTQLEIKIRKRSQGNAHSIGDRIPYVVITGSKKDKSSDLSEDPIFALENKVPINYKWYLENQLRKPLTRIFEPLVKNVNSIFEGEHTRKIVQNVNMNYGIAKFCKVEQTCYVCHINLKGKNKFLCDNCEGKREQVTEKVKGEYEKFSTRKTELTLQCKNCQKNEIEIICSNITCPIFYERFTVKDKVDKLADNLKKLEW